jgi:hypothetical protein
MIAIAERHNCLSNGWVRQLSPQAPSDRGMKNLGIFLDYRIFPKICRIFHINKKFVRKSVHGEAKWIKLEIYI